MAESDYDETRVVARLPNVAIEIFHRRPWQGNEELLTITLRAVPSFDAFFRDVAAANPLLLWLHAVETAWAPWIRQGATGQPVQLAQERGASPDASGDMG
jgi:hypothetical protein